MKSLLPGRIITIYISKYKFVLAILLKVLPKKKQELWFTVFVLCSSADDNEVKIQNLVETTTKNMSGTRIYECLEELHLPDPPLKHAVVDIPGQLLVNVTEEVFKIDPSVVINDYKRRQMARFL